MSFRRPFKAILTTEQLSAFQESATHDVVIGYIEQLNESVKEAKLTDECQQSEAVEAAIQILDKIEAIAKDTPAVDNKGSRFGNPAFKTFYDKVSEESAGLQNTLPNLPPESVIELTGYFDESWGNRERIDYGSGMELNFLCWILCLERLGVFQESDHKALVLRVFWRYIKVMRVLQSQYWLEPAGSHGVWGLDDYHFLPFLFGSSQLCGHKYLRPKSIHDNDILEQYSKYYMYLACIQFINSIKTASLRWHSPMLDDISGVKTWEKVNMGMIKMYRAEVLGKLPVVQHFLFGSILSVPLDFPSNPTPSDGGNYAHAGHVHDVKNRWGDCCGIPVPSAFGAKVAVAGGTGTTSALGPSQLLSGGGIRPVPFD